MTPEERLTSNESSDPVNWPQVDEFLRSGQYEQAATLLHEAQVASQQRGNTALTEILAVAHQICLTCAHYHAEVAWHQQALKKAVQREYELKPQLQTLLNLVSSRDTFETLETYDTSAAVPGADLELSGRGESELGKPLSLWQRVQKLLGKRLSQGLFEQEASTGSIEPLFPASTEEADRAAAVLSGKAARRIPSVTDEDEFSTPPHTEVEIAYADQKETVSAELSSVKETIPFTVETDAPTPLSTGDIDISAPPPTEPEAYEAEPYADEVRSSALSLTEPIKQSTGFEAEVEEPTQARTEEAETLKPLPTEEVVAPAPVHSEETKAQTIPPPEDASLLAVSSAEAELPASSPPPEETEASATLAPEMVEVPARSFPEDAESPAEPPFVEEKQDKQAEPTLVVYCLGPFQVYQDLVTHRKRPIAKEVLMELFWPDASPDAARNNLNVAIYGLRQTLRQIRPDFSHVLFQNDAYLLNPELHIWVDIEAFRKSLRTARDLEQRGELALAIREYRAAVDLYQGEFLAEDSYEDWLLSQRQSLEHDHFNLLDLLSRYYFDQEEFDVCATMCSKMLAFDPCREMAHRRLMRCYSHKRQRYLALRQYHLCVEALTRELDVGPSQRTKELYEQIRQR
jgi:DNA-binding SARP family transcriptional activator